MEEILMFECYLRQETLYIHIPGCGLINPQYKLVDQSLRIKLNNKDTTYIIKKLSDDMINKIIQGKAFLVERLNLENQIHHFIEL